MLKHVLSNWIEMDLTAYGYLDKPRNNLLIIYEKVNYCE